MHIGLAFDRTYCDPAHVVVESILQTTKTCSVIHCAGTRKFWSEGFPAGFRLRRYRDLAARTRVLWEHAATRNTPEVETTR